MSVSLSVLGGAGWQFLSDVGQPLSGGLLYSYAAGTTTPRATYTSSTGGTANANPIVLDSAGRVPYEIWLTDQLNYKFVLKTSTGVEIRSWDNVSGALSAYNLALSTGATTIGNTPSGSISALTVQAAINELDIEKAVKGANSDITSLSAITAINSGQLAGLRNRFINGGMQVAQRGDVTYANGTRMFGPDRWLFVNTSGTVSAALLRSSTYTGATTGLAFFADGLTATTAVCEFGQRIEAANCAGMNGKQVTLSGRLFQNLGFAVAFTPAIYTPTVKDDFSSVTVIATGSAIAVLQDVDNQFSVTFTLGSNSADNGLYIGLKTSAQTCISKQLAIADMQLEVGSVATTFEHRPYGMELALCQRYYERISYTTPSAGALYTTYPYKVTKWNTPTRNLIAGTNDGATDNGPDRLNSMRQTSLSSVYGDVTYEIVAEL